MEELFGPVAAFIADLPLAPFRYAPWVVLVVVSPVVGLLMGSLRWWLVSAAALFSVTNLAVGTYILAHPEDARWARGRADRLEYEQLADLAGGFFRTSGLSAVLTVLLFIVVGFISRKYTTVKKSDLRRLQAMAARTDQQTTYVQSGTVPRQSLYQRGEQFE